MQNDYINVYVIVLFEIGRKAVFDYYFTDDVGYNTLHVGIDRYRPRTWNQEFHVLGPGIGAMDGKRYHYRVVSIFSASAFVPTHDTVRNIHGKRVTIPVMIYDGVGYDEWGSSDGRPTLAWDGKRWRTLLHADWRKPIVTPLPLPLQ